MCGGFVLNDKRGIRFNREEDLTCMLYKAYLRKNYISFFFFFFFSPI